jgi:dTDP-4-amino-4,6-dideoxy-D-galactose acyltransferase
MSINLLEWDTNFFKKRIGKLNLGSESIFNFTNQLNNFDIVYIFSDSKILINAPLMDVKVTYKKTIQKKISLVRDIVQFDVSKHDYNKLLMLTYQSGHHSRFLKDSSFSINDFKRLYKQWINNSIDDKNTLVFIHYDGLNINGFVTVTNEINFAQIGLIAVDSETQGKGIGKELIKAAERSLEIGKSIFVSTQETNIGACKFYESLGFEIIKKEFIYHYANNTI